MLGNPCCFPDVCAWYISVQWNILIWLMFGVSSNFLVPMLAKRQNNYFLAKMVEKHGPSLAMDPDENFENYFFKMRESWGRTMLKVGWGIWKYPQKMVFLKYPTFQPFVVLEGWWKYRTPTSNMSFVTHSDAQKYQRESALTQWWDALNNSLLSSNKIQI